jgi:hypothetical protein
VRCEVWGVRCYCSPVQRRTCPHLAGEAILYVTPWIKVTGYCQAQGRDNLNRSEVPDRD